MPIFSPHIHSPYKISRFTSYLKLLVLPEVKYKKRTLTPCRGEKASCLAVHGSLKMNHEVVAPLPVILASDVSQRCGLGSLVLNMEGATLKTH